MPLIEFCKDCRRCCNGEDRNEFELFLSPSEEKRLRENGYSFTTEKVRGGFVIPYGKENCPFLSKIGCILPDDLKPLDCKIFPLTFKYEKGKFRLYMSGECQYSTKLPVNWIKQSILELADGIKDWDKETVKAYTSRIYKTQNKEMDLEDVLNGMQAGQKS